jgi:group I intron endonuclease
MNKIIGIYKITNLINGKVYIGESKDIYDRWNQYNNLTCKGQRKLYNSFVCHGLENHKFEIIMECAFEDLKYFESCFQEMYIVVEKGLNLKYTGRDDIKFRLSDESKNKISNTQKNKYANGHENWNKGKYGVYSEDALKKMSESKKKLYESGYVNYNKGKKASEESKKKMSESAKNRSDESKKNMSLAAKKKYENGYIHPMKGKKLSEEHKIKLSEKHKGKKLSEETRKKMSESRKSEKNHNSKKVINIETNEIYDSLSEMCIILNISYNTMRPKLAGRRKNETPFKYL